MDEKQCVVLARRPAGAPTEGDFRVETRTMPPLEDGQFLTRNTYLSLDAGFRNWMDEDSGDHVLPAMPLNEPVMGLTLSQVVESRHPDYQPQQWLMARFAWETASISDGSDFIARLPELRYEPSYYLGVLGDTGLSAYFGLVDHGEVSEGETVLISAAAGAVGSVAGQLAKRLGARVVGIVSGAEKCARLCAELGYDGAIDRLGDVDEQLGQQCPDGVDVYFDNVGGPLLQHVLGHINEYARVLMCGAVSTYNAGAPVPGPDNLFALVTKQARLQGFLTHTQADRYDEVRAQLAQWIERGELQVFEYKLSGIEQTPKAFCDLFRGRNFGKTLVELPLRAN